MGRRPPASEINTRPPLSAKGRTYTSARPDSSETYATHRPSGENLPVISAAVGEVLSARTPWVESSDTLSRSKLALAMPLYTTWRPSGDRSAYQALSRGTTASCGGPLPSAGCHHRLARPLCVDA